MTGLATQAVEAAVETAAKGPLIAVKGFFSSAKVKIIIALVAAAIAIGGFLIVQNHWLINKNVAAKVENHDQKATIQSYETKSKVDDASAKIDQKFAQQHEQSEKEYTHVREVIHEAPAQDRNAPASPVVIGTLNGLERLHYGPSGGVPDADVPVG